MVVSDTSVLIYLIEIGRIDLLQSLTEEVLIPEAVAHELNKGGDTLPPDLKSLPVRVIQASEYSTRIREAESLGLDLGETEAIALALTLDGALLLIDERKGREVAKKLGLKFTGLLGVLRVAKLKGRVELVKPLVDELLQLGFRIHPSLYKSFLRTVGE